jgi:hypothetical protein
MVDSVDEVGVALQTHIENVFMTFIKSGSFYGKFIARM